MQTLRVGAAYPDPPFNGMPDDGGLDVDLMTAVADKLNMRVEFVPYVGADFNGIFDALAAGDFDCVAAGTTVTPEREKKADFVAPYLISGQALAVDTRRLPNVRSVGDLEGLTIGVQQATPAGLLPRNSSPTAGPPGSRSTTTAASAPRSTTSPLAAATRS